MVETPNGSSRGQGDRVAAETLIRTSVLALANGAAIGDMDEVIRRNAGNVSHADVMAGRLNTSVLGDIISSVEQAKGSKPFNWPSATDAQIKAYFATNGIKLPGYGPDGQMRASGADRTGNGDGNASSSAKYDAMPGSYGAIYKSLGSEGYNAAQVTTALNFAKSIGINDKAYAGYFVGASKTTRDAISEHIKSGKAVTDDDVTSTDDATAVIGTVKSGKMKQEEAPGCVQHIMKDMKEQGVDPATAEPKAVHKYFKEHPKALEKAKESVKQDKAAVKDVSDTKLVSAIEAEAKNHKSPDSKTQPTKKAAGPHITGSL